MTIQPFNKNQYVDPSSYDIKKLILRSFSSGEEIDITYLMAELNIFEDLYKPCTTGNIVLNDSLNLVSNLPIMEGDIIEGELTRASSDIYAKLYDFDYRTDFMFEIVKISKQEKMKQDIQMVVVQFVSSTWTDNFAARISKSYHKMPYTDMAADIYNFNLDKGGLSGELPFKSMGYVPSEGLYNAIIPNLSPYDALSWLAARATYAGTCNYVFFENKHMFNFIPISELMSGPVVADYFTSSVHTRDSSEVAQTKESDYNQILKMKYVEHQDASVAALSGMLSNRLIKTNLHNKIITDYTMTGDSGSNYILEEPYNYLEEFDKLKHANGKESMIRDYTNTKYKEGGGALLTVYNDASNQWDDMESYDAHLWARQRKGHMAMNRFMKLEITIAGNFSRTIGQKIRLNIESPEYIDASAGKKNPTHDQRFNGSYLITAARRKFTFEKHHMVLELVRDDYPVMETRRTAAWGGNNDK